MMTLEELKRRWSRGRTLSADDIAEISEALPDLLAAVEALREARDRERNPFDDGQTERFVRWSAILSRLGVE